MVKRQFTQKMAVYIVYSTVTVDSVRIGIVFTLSSYVTLNDFLDSGLGFTPWSFDWSDKLAGAQLLLYELTGKSKYQ
jgi:hypothetical protein